MCVRGVGVGVLLVRGAVSLMFAGVLYMQMHNIDRECMKSNDACG